MNRQTRGAILLLAVALAAWVAPASGAYPPLREDNVGQVSFEVNSGGLSFKVYDPQRGAWKVGNASGEWQIMQKVQVKDGIVYWVWDTADLKRQVGAAVYDPGKGQWMIYQKNLGKFDFNIFNIQAGQGIVAFQYYDSENTYAPYNVNILCYNAENGKWENFAYFPFGSLVPWFLTVKDGVVAWLYCSGGYVVSLEYIAPHYQFLRGEVAGLMYGIVGSNLAVIEGTVYYTFTSPNPGGFVIGYEVGKGWHSGMSVPSPDFFAAPSTGPAPLWVWFWDRSFAWSSWNWSFGDGKTSNERSPYHVYEHPAPPPAPVYPYGVYFVNEIMSNGSTFASGILVTPPQPPALGLLLD